jgi:hypothetical protein
LRVQCGGRRFKRSDCRGSDSHNAAAGSKGAVDAVSRLGRNLNEFLVHRVIGQPLDADRLKRAQANVQRQRGTLDAAGVEASQDLGREVEAGRGRGRAGAWAMRSGGSA